MVSQFWLGPHMFNFKEIFALLNSRNACEQVKNGKELTAMVLRLCKDRGSGARKTERTKVSNRHGRAHNRLNTHLPIER